jgi:pilus assembly protein CpaE
MEGQSNPMQSGDNLNPLEARTITIFTPRGGVGKTSLAVNLAAALAGINKGSVALVDLALETTHCGLMMNLKPRATLASLSEWPEPDLTPNDVESLLSRHPSGVALLTGADNPSEAELVTTAAVELIWPHLVHHFGFIIVDGGSHFDDISLAALDRSDLILLVFSPDLGSVKSITDTLKILQDLSFSPGRIMIAANWTFPENPLLLQRIKQILKVEVISEIPYDAQGFSKAINTGRPLVLDAPQSPVAKTVVALAHLLVDEKFMF